MNSKMGNITIESVKKIASCSFIDNDLALIDDISTVFIYSKAYSSLYVRKDNLVTLSIQYNKPPMRIIVLLLVQANLLINARSVPIVKVLPSLFQSILYKRSLLVCATSPWFSCLPEPILYSA